jgi:tRNA (cytidine/uridine-2'-O-)-methyltransferase
LSGRRVFALTTRSKADLYKETFLENDVFVFGSETSGLPEAILKTFPEKNRLRIPMLPGNRSLNLSNAVAVTVYEAWRQLGFR